MTPVRKEKIIILETISLFPGAVSQKVLYSQMLARPLGYRGSCQNSSSGSKGWSKANLPE